MRKQTQTLPDHSLEDDINKWLGEFVRPLVQSIFSDSRNALDGTQPAAAGNHGHGCDAVQVYGKVVLELGLVYLQLNDAIQVSNRDRLMRTLKYLMVFLKSHSNRSNYALIILQLLCQPAAGLTE